jgi:RNA polymerase sigma-70 factor (ECF subfamily)
VYEDVTVVVETEFEALFREAYPRLVSLGVLKSGRPDVARELAQETMLRAHARWDELASYDSPMAWCRTVMSNLLIDHHRSTSSERRAVERLGHGQAGREDPPTTSLARWNDLMSGLPDRQRLVVTLYYADDLSVAEIARSLGTTRGAVKATLFKARRALRARLGAEAEGGTDG